MNKISKALKAIWWIMRKPILLNKILDDDDIWLNHVEKLQGIRGGLPVIGLNQLTDINSISISPMTFYDGGSLPTDMMLLATLSDGIPDCRYFEIGTWRGESVSIVAERASQCFTLCLSDEEMRILGMPEANIESHMMFSDKLANVKQLRGDSKTFDFESLYQKFDLIFIDGNHHYEYVLNDTRNVFKHLVHENSVVVWHDYAHHPDKIRYEVMAAILDGVGDERKNMIYHVGHTKCAIFTGRTYPSVNIDFPQKPKEYYTLSISRRQLDH